MPFAIRPLCQADAAALGSLHNRLWRISYTGLLPQEVLDARDDADSTDRWRKRALAHEVNGMSAEGCTTYVAHDEAGAPTGWAGSGPARDSNAPTPLELWALYVAPEHWGTGVASALIDVVLGPEPAYLWVLDGNERAAAFYRKVGFQLDDATTVFGETTAVERRMVRG